MSELTKKLISVEAKDFVSLGPIPSFVKNKIQEYDLKY